VKRKFFFFSFCCPLPIFSPAATKSTGNFRLLVTSATCVIKCHKKQSRLKFINESRILASHLLERCHVKKKPTLNELLASGSLYYAVRLVYIYIY